MTATYISTGSFDAYTELSVEEAVKCLANGDPIDCWWFDTCGRKHSSTVVFADYNFVRTVDDSS